jgi:hypothetical protein
MKLLAASTRSRWTCVAGPIDWAATANPMDTIEDGIENPDRPFFGREAVHAWSPKPLPEPLHEGDVGLFLAPALTTDRPAAHVGDRDSRPAKENGVMEV